MGNIASPMLSSFNVKFSRESPNDFYLSGDRVQGIIEIVTKDKGNDSNFKHGPLYVELIGKLKDCKTNNTQQRITKGVQIFFRQRAQVIKIPNDNQQLETNRCQIYRWVFDGLLDSLLPSSLPPYDDSDPWICYYARVYIHGLGLYRSFSFLVFTPSPRSIVVQQSLQNFAIEASAQHEGIKLHGILSNNGLAVPGETLILQIEINNPMKVTIKSMRVTLKQYRNIIYEETDFTIFSTLLPGFEPKGFTNEYHQSTHELSLPLESCRVMAPTSSYKNVRYELHIQCHIHCLFNKHFTLILPVICTTDHQQTIKVMDELKSLPEILEHLSIEEEENSPPNYEDFVASEILPTYEDVIY